VLCLVELVGGGVLGLPLHFIGGIADRAFRSLTPVEAG
jgi:hypothetical protein